MEHEWLDSFRKPPSYFNWRREGDIQYPFDEVREVNGVDEHQTCSVMNLGHEWWDDDWCTNAHPAVCQLKRSLQSPVTTWTPVTTGEAMNKNDATQNKGNGSNRIPINENEPTSDENNGVYRKSHDAFFLITCHIIINILL